MKKMHTLTIKDGAVIDMELFQRLIEKIKEGFVIKYEHPDNFVLYDPRRD
jgi:hypothetical protein